MVATLYTVHLSNQGVVSFLWPSTFGLVATLVVGYAGSLVLGSASPECRQQMNQTASEQVIENKA